MLSLLAKLCKSLLLLLSELSVHISDLLLEFLILIHQHFKVLVESIQILLAGNK